ncbi:N-acetyltransferase [Capsulimonas corticalis]|uniref:N-acetyltransferase n=1 Tax=Capsulimonas corticalis TaxID=2219043 RepID=A0A402D1N3_9BACT|nr:GNAT family N-acetyltransferase [Capsulimonas corticalis]BDI28633.1 N-acetyltransferase [Capsulimonas corticalis]
MDRIRLATTDDAEAVLRIYGPICAESAITFDVTPPPVDVLREEIAGLTREFPWLMYERDGVVAGYVYASRHRDRAAYQWAVTTSIYLDPQYHRQGIGRRLYAALFALLELQGYYTAYAGITQPNEASIGLHESLGFKEIGVYANVGFKLGEWRNVSWWGLTLRSPSSSPAPPTPLYELAGTPEFEAILAHPPAGWAGVAEARG